MNEQTIRLIQTHLLGTSFRSVYAPPLPTPVPIRGLDYAAARQYVGQTIPGDYRYASAMYHGDHWIGGWGWAGPIPFSADSSSVASAAGESYLWSRIATGFVSRNVLKEIVDRHVNGVLARLPKWTLMPVGAATGDEEMDEATKALIAEASAFLRDWIAARGVHRLLRRYLTDLLMPVGRGCFRFFVPPGLASELSGTSAIRQLNVGDTVGEALQRIYLEKPDVTESAVITDPDTQRQVGIRLIAKPDRAILTFLDQDGERTFTRTVNNEGGTAGVSYDLGGRLLMFQGVREPLVTRQFLQMQRALNFAESVIPRTNETAGFLQRIITNAQLRGTWTTLEDGTLKFNPDPNAEPVFGAGVTNFISGQVLEDDDGKFSQATPGVHIQEPVTPTGVMESSRHFRRGMHLEGHQAHMIEESGMPPELARQEYGLSLLDSAIPVCDAFNWILGTGLAFGEALRGEEGRYTEQLRATCTAFVNVGPVPPEEKTAMIAAFEKAVLARESVQESAFNVEDVDAENDRIASQPGSAIDVVIRQMNAVKLGTEAGMSVEQAALAAGFSEEQAAAMQKSADDKAKKDAEAKMAEIKAGAVQPMGTGQRPGRPSGTDERNPGQQQDKGARKLQSKPRDRKQRRPGGATGAGPA
jgi:hypothetical protein